MASIFNKPFRWKNLIAPWQNIDWFLLLLTITVTAWGSLTIHTVTNSLNDTLLHAIVGGIGVFITFLLARWHYEHFLDWYWFIYAITNVVLLAVNLMGVTAGGAQRWLTIAGFSVQPSEFAKLGIIITLAAVLHHRPIINRIGKLVQVLLVVAVPWALVVSQPDLGSSLVLGAIALVMLYWANTNLGWLIVLISPAVAAIAFHVSEVAAIAVNVDENVYVNLVAGLSWTAFIVVMAWRTLPGGWFPSFASLVVNIASGKLGEVFWGVLAPYQKFRILAFLEPSNYQQEQGFQLIQSRIAIGAGGLWGNGLKQGTETQLVFVPEQQNDFIFSAVGEQLGFVGSFGLLILFWLICARLITIALQAKDHFGSFLAIGVFAMIVFQVIVNIGMTVGVAPITGLPLPWMSAGGSALLMNFLAIGLVESVANYRKRKSYFS